MVFSSLIFMFVFLPITLLAYYISPKNTRNLILLIMSLIFYAWGEPIYVFLMIFSMIFDYINGRLIDKYRDNKAIARGVFITSIVVNLGILCFFKYFNFFIDNINAIFNLSIVAKKLPLPLGISFYTFQTMSYTIDVYLGKIKVQKNLISYGTYLTMFPQLVAGPIVKYGDIAEQLDNRKETLTKFGQGVEIFLNGLFKKILLANNIGMLWTSIKATPMGEMSVVGSWIGIVAFTFQIYFDFSGYSDMAIGLGKMFGFELMENFNYPYISKSATEFWRRWHISLGSWFREYVYIPLGGNRVGTIKLYRNIFIVWFLTGLWHGASWNFIIWGLYFGLLLVIEKTFLLKWLDKKPEFISHIYACLVIVIGWVFFEFEKLGDAFNFIKVMFGGGKVFIDNQTKYYLCTNVIIFILVAVCSTPLLKNLIGKFKKKAPKISIIVLPIIYIILTFISTAYLVNQSYNPFLYFRF